MSRTAILSDIHGNLEALEAVLRDLRGQRIGRVLVLGDTVGYGPNPRECLERIAPEAEVLLIGNHERDVLEPDPDMEVDQELRDWTAAQVAGSAAWERLAALVKEQGGDEVARRRLPGLHLVHASPSAPTAQYIWPAHPCQYLVFNRQIGTRLREFLDEFEERIGVCGHTHTPAFLTEYEGHVMFDPYETKLDWHAAKSFVSPDALFVVPLGPVKLTIPTSLRIVINPGSVGQPRDGDPRASYAILDDDTVEIRRVSYDQEPTLRKLQALPLDDELREELTTRLQQGE